MSTDAAFGEVNREHFDKHAHTIFDHDWIKALSQQFTEELQARVNWLGIRKVTHGPAGTPVRLLDYACGSGLASKALFQYVTHLRGIDVSGEMVRVYNDFASSQSIPTEKMHAIEGDLLTPADDARDPVINTEEYHNFDVAILSMALHHVKEPNVLIQRLVDRLKSGGILVVIDWTPEGEIGNEVSSKGPHPAAHTVAFDGFNREQMGDFFTEAGCSEWDYVTLDKATIVPMAVNGEKIAFFARGRKA